MRTIEDPAVRRRAARIMFFAGKLFGTGLMVEAELRRAKARPAVIALAVSRFDRRIQECMGWAHRVRYDTSPIGDLRVRVK